MCGGLEERGIQEALRDCISGPKDVGVWAERRGTEGQLFDEVNRAHCALFFWEVFSTLLDCFLSVSEKLKIDS